MAPNADRVSVVGDFNSWTDVLRCAGSGRRVWEIFVPGLAEGARYKFEIRSSLHGELLLKTIPRLRFEAPALTASIVTRPSTTRGRSEWLVDRAASHALFDRR